MRIEFVSSPQNPKIKELAALQEKSSLRREKGLFVVEGKREIDRAVSAGYEMDTLFYCPGLGGRQHKASRLIEIPAEIYARVAYRGTTEGEIAEFREKRLDLDGVVVGENPLIVVLESVEKPGNLGAVLRSADAAGTDAVIICDPLTDLYNPNLIRASLGAVFTKQVVTASSGDAIAWLKANKIQILTAQLQDSSWYYDKDMKVGTALVIGTESTGLTDIWRDAADAHIRIPMLGDVDSLNASVSAAILLYEAVRQRNA